MKKRRRNRRKRRFFLGAGEGGRFVKRDLLCLSGVHAPPEPPTLPLGHPPFYFIICISDGSTKGEECAINKVWAGSG